VIAIDLGANPSVRNSPLLETVGLDLYLLIGIALLWRADVSLAWNMPLSDLVPATYCEGGLEMVAMQSERKIFSSRLFMGEQAQELASLPELASSGFPLRGTFGARDASLDVQKAAPADAARPFALRFRNQTWIPIELPEVEGVYDSEMQVTVGTIAGYYLSGTITKDDGAGHGDINGDE